MASPTSTSNLGGEVGAFRVVAFVEAISYLALLTASVVHRGFDGPDLVSVLGPIHGIAVLVYFVLVLRIREGQGWDLGRTILILLASAVPFGGFWAGRHLKQDRATTT
jgi:integral membrane protein